tara:strand:- start:609 stop:842 length:234 start_codon:yes stop_codon:yes gene_type:complete
MLEKFLKMLFSFKLKKNINIFLIIIILLIIMLLFFGNYNLIETYKAVANPRKNDKEAIVGEKTIRSFTDKMVKARHY